MTSRVMKGVLKYSIAFILITVIFYYLLSNGYFDVLEKVTINDFLILTSITFFSYCVAGLQIYYLTKVQNGILIKLADVVLLPISMSLFSYIIPTNGGMLYSVFFLKKKYNVDSSKGFSIGVVSIYISFIITGVFGVISIAVIDNVNLWVLPISVALIISPVILHFFNALFKQFRFRKDTIWFRIQNYIDSIIKSANQMMKHRKVVMVNIVISLLYFVLVYFSYQWMSHILDLNLSITSIFVIILITRISSLIRLLPGNLGLEEMYMAGIFKFIGQSVGVGIVFTLLLRLTTVVLFIPLGIIHFLVNLEYLKINDLRDYIRSN